MRDLRGERLGASDFKEWIWNSSYYSSLLISPPPTPATTRGKPRSR